MQYIHLALKLMLSTFARLAGDAVGATKMDRPERCAVNPENGEVYVTLNQYSEPWHITPYLNLMQLILAYSAEVLRCSSKAVKVM